MKSVFITTVKCFILRIETGINSGLAKLYFYNNLPESPHQPTLLGQKGSRTPANTPMESAYWSERVPASVVLNSYWFMLLSIKAQPATSLQRLG
ncbi:hypothetical protein ILYODFUR_036660 [Ilyodon furcidens]|uniref:Uncharacterized protein n=1 Tax=Ilyodon furcidens TaxID=33524 RepID=A0ABV0T386_9TELE